ncbi:hypothetical protein [Caminibacter sp.]
MNKLLIFLPLLLFAEFINLPYTFSLKKDEIKTFKIYYKKYIYPLKIRWTLYKNDYLVVLYNFNGFPRQVMLKKIYPLDMFKIDIAKFPTFYPYLLIKFDDFNDKIATFKIYLFNSKGVRVEELK